jgi:hypothetical protein
MRKILLAIKNYNFLGRTALVIKTLYYFTTAVLNQEIAAYLDRRMENKKRQWKAIGTFGSGVVPLGKCNMAEATEKTSKFGAVSYADVEQAIIFFNEK